MSTAVRIGAATGAAEAAAAAAIAAAPPAGAAVAGAAAAAEAAAAAVAQVEANAPAGVPYEQPDLNERIRPYVKTLIARTKKSLSHYNTQVARLCKSDRPNISKCREIIQELNAFLKEIDTFQKWKIFEEFEDNSYPALNHLDAYRKALEATVSEEERGNDHIQASAEAMSLTAVRKGLIEKLQKAPSTIEDYKNKIEQALKDYVNRPPTWRDTFDAQTIARLVLLGVILERASASSKVPLLRLLPATIAMVYNSSLLWYPSCLIEMGLLIHIACGSPATEALVEQWEKLKEDHPYLLTLGLLGGGALTTVIFTTFISGMLKTADEALVQEMKEFFLTAIIPVIEWISKHPYITGGITLASSLTSSKVREKVSSAAYSLGNRVKNLISGTASTISSAVKSAWNGMTSAFSWTKRQVTARPEFPLGAVTGGVALAGTTALGCSALPIIALTAIAAIYPAIALDRYRTA